MGLGEFSFSDEIIKAILDYIWPIDSPRWCYSSTSPPHPELWRTLLALSVVNKRFRKACLPRLFVHADLRTCRKIGLLWKAIQSNPSLGSYTQCCSCQWRYPLYGEEGDDPHGPTKYLEFAFQHRSMEEHLAKAQARFEERAQRAQRARELAANLEGEGGIEDEALEPDEDEMVDGVEAQDFEIDSEEDEDEEIDEDSDEDSEEDFEKDFKEAKRRLKLAESSSTGPDGKGFDPIIKSAQDLKEAIITICLSWTSIRNIHWSTEVVPIFSEVVSHVASLDTLEDLYLSEWACEEDFYYETDPSTGKLHPPAPLWLLAPRLKKLDVLNMDPLPSDSPTTRLRMERNKSMLIKLLVSAKKLEDLNIHITSWTGAPEDEPRKKPSSKKGNQSLEIVSRLKEIVPPLACIPSVYAGSVIRQPAWRTNWRKGAESLYSHVKRLVDGKLKLEVSDVKALGVEAALDLHHEIHFFGEWLQEEETASAIVSRWNERYS